MHVVGAVGRALQEQKHSQAQLQQWHCKPAAKRRGEGVSGMACEGRLWSGDRSVLVLRQAGEERSFQCALSVNKEGRGVGNAGWGSHNVHQTSSSKAIAVADIFLCCSLARPASKVILVFCFPFSSRRTNFWSQAETSHEAFQLLATSPQ